MIILSQEKEIDTSFVSAFQISYNYFKPLDKKRINIDSLGFDIKDGDTLVYVNRIPKTQDKGVKVPYEYKDSTFLELYKNIVFNKKNYLIRLIRIKCVIGKTK